MLLQFLSIVSAIKIYRVTPHDYAQAIEIEMSIARLNGFECPLNEVTPFRQRARPLGPFQLRAYASVLIFGCDCHHVRITEDFISAHRGKMMDKSHEAVADESAPSPTTRLLCND